MSSTRRRERSFTSIYSAPLKPQLRSDSSLVDYDYLDSSDHSGYTNAWLKAVSHDKVSADYCDAYADSWVNFIKTAERTTERMTERKIKYTRSQLFNILYETTSTSLPIAPLIPQTVRQCIDVSKPVYQPARQPNNPPNNIVKDFSSSSPTYQLCAKCRARII